MTVGPTAGGSFTTTPSSRRSWTLGRAWEGREVLGRLAETAGKPVHDLSHADRGFIVLRDRENGRLVPKAIKYRHEEDAQTLPSTE